MAYEGEFIEVSMVLDEDGLVWHPEIGDEVADREKPEKVSVLVSPQGHTPHELRERFLWLPTVEQLVTQFEARQALVYHAGVNERLLYEAIIRTSEGLISTAAKTLRIAFGLALHKLLDDDEVTNIH